MANAERLKIGFHSEKSVKYLVNITGKFDKIVKYL